MAIRVMKYMWDYRLPDSIPSRQKSTAKLVLLKLGDNSNDEGYCWPSIDRIAHECDLSYRSVSRVLSELESAEIIKRVPRYTNGVRTSNGYWINIRKLQEESSPYEADDKQSVDNPFGNPEGHQVRQCETSSPLVSDSMTYKPPVTIKEPSINEHFSKEKRIDVFSLDGYEFCKESIRHLMEVDTQLVVNYGESNIYIGGLTIEQIDSCEDKLREVLDEPSECPDLIYSIYQDRKMWKRKSISLPYILMAFTDTEEFSHIALNCSDWLE